MDLQSFISFLTRYSPVFFDGLLVTAWVAVWAAPAAFLLGMLLLLPALGGLKPLAALVHGFVEVMRNTPLLVQIYLLYFGLPLLGIFWGAIVCGVIAIALQHGAFLSEIMRAGIQSLSDRQWEAGKAIGMRRFAILRLIILPQALVKVTPAIGNQLIVLVKDTSLVSAIGVMDLTLSGKVLIERSGASFEVFIAVAMFYLILTTSLGLAVRLVEAIQSRRYA